MDFTSFVYKTFAEIISSFLKRNILIPPFTLRRKVPANLVEGELKYFENELTRNCDAVTLINLKDSLLVATDGVVIKYFSVIGESLMAPNLRRNYGLRFLFHAYFSKKKEKLAGKNYLLIYNHYGAGYGHWLADIIPRFYIMRNSLKNYKILLPENYNTYQLSTLVPFMVEKAEIEYIRNDQIYSVENLTVASHIGSTCNVKDEVIQEVRQFYIEFYRNKFEVNKGLRRIYVSREKIKNRNVTNEREVQELVLKYDFEIIHFQDYTFEEQVKITSNSSIMIGLTGSGLTNMVFLRDNSKVLEFKMREDTTNLHYFGLASALNLDYYYQLCDPDDISADRFSANFVVDIINLERNLIQMCQTGS